MPTSKKTNNEIIEILNKYLSKEKQKSLFKELTMVKGNSSFKKSIRFLLENIDK